MLRPRQNRCWGLTLALALALSIGVARAGHASCQTSYCAQERRDWNAARLTEVVAQALGGHGDADAWREAYEQLAWRALEQLESAAFHAGLDWSPFALEGDGARAERVERAKEEAKREQAAWLARWLEAMPDDADAQCIRARAAEDQAAALTELLALADRHPESTTLARCVSERLEAAGQPAVALSRARERVERAPDDAASWDFLVEGTRSLLAPAERQTLLEERARRFPDVPSYRAAVLAALRDAGAQAEADRLYAEYASRAQRPAALGPLCSALRDGALQDECWRSVLAADPGDDASPEDTRYLGEGRSALLWPAIRAHDLAAVERLLLAFPPEVAAEDWGFVVDWLKLEACPALGRELASGRLAPLEREGERHVLPLEAWARALDACGFGEHAHAVLDATDAPRTAPANSVLDRLREAERRRLRDGSSRDIFSQGRLDRLAEMDPPAARVSYFLDRVAQAPDDMVVRHDLLAALRDQSRLVGAGESQALARRALALRPDDRDWALQIGFLQTALRQDGDAAAIAGAVEGAKEATPRQRAEADFILARVARRAGRFAEASTRLQRYFLLRLRYTACGNPDCDAGVGLELREGLEDDRLARYLAERTAALAAFRAEHDRSRPPVPRPPWWREPQWPEAQWVKAFAKMPACRMQQTLERVGAEPPGPLRDERLARARSLPPCGFPADAVERALDLASPESVWLEMTRID